MRNSALTAERLSGIISVMRKFLTEVPRIACLFSSSKYTGRQFQQGVLRYANEHGPWVVQIFEGRPKEQRFNAMSLREFTGFIGDIEDCGLNERTILKVLDEERIPSVLVNDRIDKDVRREAVGRMIISTVSCDNAPIGANAAEWLLERGFQTFAFVGDISGSTWSAIREQSFRNTLAAADFACNTYPTPGRTLARNPVHEQRRLGQWIASLDKPLAVFAAHDVRGRQVLNACVEVGLNVPHDISVISCDNDELICERTSPTLTSIRFNTVDAGYAAARTLDGYLRGESRSGSHRNIIPFGFAGIVARGSTERLKLNDPLAERAMTYIRLNITASFTILELASALHVSRRLLEVRFARAVGHTLHDEIIRLRLEKAKDLLCTGNMPVADIAAACGFASASHLGTVCRKLCGKTPSALRAEVRCRRVIDGPRSRSSLSARGRAEARFARP